MYLTQCPHEQRTGFTLIELSIVLVIIGLIVGGILAGRDLISAAAIRAQIAQIEKYNTATNTFRSKYNALPGDISNATAFGFTARGTVKGTGDGDGVILGYDVDAAMGIKQCAGETVLYWRDLSSANLIDAGLNTATANSSYCSSTVTVDSAHYFPPAKIGNGNYIYVHGGGWFNGTVWITTGYNYFGISVPTATTVNSGMESNTGLSVQQAYNIDKKMDDGLPQTGSVQATFIDNDINIGSVLWAAGSNTFGGAGNYSPLSPDNSATAVQSTNCFDNNNIAGTQTYSTRQNANALNCALSFRFQ